MDRHSALQCFCRVVETGGFAAAARDLDCAPSMVTKYVQYLETWTGSRLLARTTRRMQLTEAGERFYAYCRRVLDDTDETLGALRSVSGGLSGRLVVAVSEPSDLNDRHCLPYLLGSDALRWRFDGPTGALETALDNWRAEARRLFAVVPSREHLPQRVRALVRHLQQALSDAG